ncbi:ABC transporter permease/substrate-binding protein [Lentilactobacillus sp. Marseille-Q4993]|uniref:ABC transporter permease/substrate-binding protein n=1 Tax=Lentilactobacillus sp. Marseille-Q4993 TaxID=3039492 RepID=UPI0024BC284A|nr:ABC transporter permease/substrate-binding protein [Lentilactobacillus sp. Marseille-Q4993]
MTEFLSTLAAKRSDLLTAIFQHIEISIWALVIAMVIAIPLAFYSQRKPKLATVLSQIAGVFQTIPSLAVLGLLIPIVGIGEVPAVIALVIYAILPIFQNTYVGIHSIDPQVEEAADAFGMTKWQKLSRVEIPIAMPVIMTGIRQAMVMIIGTATLAALIGSGGLGTFILLGISRNDNSITLIGAIAAAVLAVLFSLLISVLQKVRVRYSLITLAVLFFGVVGTTVYPKVVAPAETITIAGKMGSEPDILINMYKQLIHEENPRAKVVLKSNFGQTSFLFNALKTNQIQIYPEFSGTVIQSLVKLPKSQINVTTPAATYQLAKKSISDQAKMSFLKPMKYNNTYALVVKQAFAKKYNIKTISDLRRVENKLHGGFDLEFLDRNDGFRGIKKLYGLNFKTQSMDPDLRYEALRDGKINIADGYSTDFQIQKYKLVALRDDKNLFPTYQGAPLMKTSFAKKNPEIVKQLNKLAGKITETQMQKMNYEVNVNKKSAASVARNYLKIHHLIGGAD